MAESKPAETTRQPPAYDPLLRAFHRAFSPELTRAVADLGLVPGQLVLDLACGDGFYTRRLARRVGSAGRVLAADLDDAYLKRARRATEREREAGTVAVERADAYSLPFPERTFDLVWCAHSFISLDAARVLGEMSRVVKPDGQVAVLESDEFHHVLLPWPIDLELAVQRALEEACIRRHGRPSHLSPGRTVNRLFREVGLRPLRKKTYAADRQAPFSAAVRRFLTLHLRFLRGLVFPHLSDADRQRFEAFAHRDGETALFQRPDAEMTCLLTRYRARGPG